MEIFVINLKHRKDKLEKFLANLPSILSNEKINIFEAIDGSKYNIPKWFDVTNAKEKISGNYGCYLSHLEIIKNIHRPTLIFEDDAIFSEDFSEKYKQSIEYIQNLNYDLFYLGGYNNKKPAVIDKKNKIYRCFSTYRTHAYIVSGKNTAKNIELLLTDTKAWHLYLLKHIYHIDHFYGQLQQREIIKCYCIQPYICGQDEYYTSDVTPKGYLPIRW